MKRYFFVLSPCGLAGLVVSFLLFTTCKPKSTTYEPTYSIDSAQKKTLIYGVATQAFYELNTPLVKYLNEHLEGASLKIVANSSFSIYVDKVKTRYFDLAGGNGIMALEGIQNGYSILAAVVDEDANAGVILVNKDSSINHFSDLKGKLVASAGSPALGHLLNMVFLYKNGLDVSKQIKLKYLESFESVILNVYLGRCSAGFTTINGWRSFLKRRPEIASKVKLKWVTPEVAGNVLLIRNSVDEKTASQLKNLIVTMHVNEQGRKALADLGYARFVPADSNTYLPFRNLLKEYQAIIADPKK
jgi:phosphonate transport system substrate-binding protein